MDYKVVGYFCSWSVYRVEQGNFAISDIPANLCTHVIYSFATVTDSGNIRPVDPYSALTENSGRGGFKEFVKLTNINPNLKALIAIGGWNAGSERYSRIFSSESLRKAFALNAVVFLKKYGFNGLDLDWEYPAQRRGMPEDKANFVELIKTLRTEFDKYGFLLTAAVAATESSIAMSYDVPNLAKYLDFINIMTYDFHGAYDGKTGHNSPLFQSNSERHTGNAVLNVDASIKAWIKLGAPSTKLVMGISLYGRTFTLASMNTITPYSASSGPGKAGPSTQTPGALGYNEICDIEKTDRAAKVYWDNEAMVPYLVTGDQWMSYDNERSAQMKIDYIKKNNLGGVMVWSIDTDDFRGNYSKCKYPMLTFLSRELKN